MTDNRTNPPPDIRAACRELLGDAAFWRPLAPGLLRDDPQIGWQSAVAVVLGQMLGIDPRAAERWLSGQNEMPRAVAVHIRAMLVIARRSRSDAAKDRERRAAEHATDDWAVTGRNIADRYPVTLARLAKR